MRRALHLTADTNTIDGDTRPNPPGLWQLPTLDLFAQMVRLVSGDGTILLHYSAARNLALPTGELPIGDDAKKHPVAEALRGGGWRLKEVQRWFHVKHPDYGHAHIGLTEFIDSAHFPLIDTAANTTAALLQWHEITGHAWTGAAGDAVNEILRSITYAPHRGRNVKPRRPEFWSSSGPTLPGETPDDPPRYPAETWYTPGQWRRPLGPEEEVTQISGLDRVRAHLGTLTCTPVAATHLEHTPSRLTYDRSRVGWHLVRCEPWRFPDLLPDPAGYPSRRDQHDTTGARLLTTPRLALIDEMAQKGEYDYEILDAWTAPATPVLKTLGAELRKAWQGAKLIQDPAVRKLVRAGVKEGYRQLPGHWRSNQGSVQRADWGACLIAQNATNTWRRAYELGMGHGVWPIQIDTDSLYYAGSMQEVAEIARGAGWTVWDADREDLDDVTELGHWRTGGTLVYNPERDRFVRVREGAAA